jgi:hypothetical protein
MTLKKENILDSGTTLANDSSTHIAWNNKLDLICFEVLSLMVLFNLHVDTQTISNICHLPIMMCVNKADIPLFNCATSATLLISEMNSHFTNANEGMQNKQKVCHSSALILLH